MYRRRAGEELRLDSLDASLIQTAFTHPGMVYLLMAPATEGPDRAAFFIQERGEVHGYANYGDFPFDAEFLQDPSWMRQPGVSSWIPIPGFGASLLALADWFIWLRQDTTAPVAAAPAAQQAVVPPAPAPTAAAPAPAKQTAEVRDRAKTSKKRKTTSGRRKRRH